MFHLSRFAVVLTVLLVSSLAHAAPVVYTESADGDLPVIGFPLPTFTFDVGLNTISGTFGTDANENADFDSFAFVIPTGFSMLSGSVLLTDNQGNITSSRWQLNSGSANSGGGLSEQSVVPSSPGSATITALSSGTYNMSHTLYIASDQDPNTADYVFSFNVNIVPEPTTLAVLGLTTLALLKRRRR